MLENSNRELIKSISVLAYFMRGGITYDDLMWKTPVERQIIEEVVEERLKAESKKPFPLY